MAKENSRREEDTTHCGEASPAGAWEGQWGGGGRDVIVMRVRDRSLFPFGQKKKENKEKRLWFKRATSILKRQH